MWHSGNVSWFGHVSGRHLDRKVNRDTSSLQRKRQSQVGNSKYRLKYRSIRSEKQWKGVTNDFKADSRIKRRRGKRCRRLEEQSTLMQRKKSRRRYCGIIRQLVLIKRKQRQRAQSNVFFSPKERRNACGSDDKDIFFFFVLIRKGRGKNSSRTDPEISTTISTIERKIFLNVIHFRIFDTTRNIRIRKRAVHGCR